MESKFAKGTHIPVFLSACTIALAILLGSAVYATSPCPLDALNKASQVLSGCYIALATDDGFHYFDDSDQPYPYVDVNTYGYPFTQLTAAQTRNILSTASCHVYIDCGATSGVADLYTAAQLAVSGAMEDTSYGTYTFPKLKAALAQ